MPKLHVNVFQTGQQVSLYQETVEGSFRIGRQDNGESEKIELVQSPSTRSDLNQKLIIATGNEREYSRQFSEVHTSPDAIEIRNTSHQTIYVGHDLLAAGESKVIQWRKSPAENPPVELTLGDRTIELTLINDGEFKASLFSLATAPKPPALERISGSQVDPAMSLVAIGSADAIESSRLLELLDSMMHIFQESPAHSSFFDRTAMAMIQFLRLDHVLVAFRESAIGDFTFKVDRAECNGDWCFHSFRDREGVELGDWRPSTKILDMIASGKRTVYELPDALTQSLLDVKCLVASPLLNSKNEVIGVVYGDRTVTKVQSMLTEAEARFVELFANGISLGIERLNRERQISEMRLRFNQFFTPELASELESNQGLLAPRSAEVSILFADIRGFSRISERIGAGPTISWINAVMNQLSDCVLNYEGVVVDYVGDEILAMWGAPIDRERHRELAVKAALDMLDCIPELNEQWESVLGEPLSIGIGINSGEAQVGNIGSDRKFKYGPLGDVVNVASRVQSSTRQMGTTFLITESTAAKLPDEILTRKIRTVRFVNVERPIAVFEIPSKVDENWLALKQGYEEGLAFFEEGRLREASQSLAGMINQFPEDTPAIQLLSDTVSGLSDTDFDPVCQLSKK